jgi:hypothetical protein
VLQIVLLHLKDKAEHLLHPFFGFTREQRRNELAEKISWSEVLNWSMTKNQEIIAVNTPAIFACLTVMNRLFILLPGPEQPEQPDH